MNENLNGNEDDHGDGHYNISQMQWSSTSTGSEYNVTETQPSFYASEGCSEEDMFENEDAEQSQNGYGNEMSSEQWSDVIKWNNIMSLNGMEKHPSQLKADDMLQKEFSSVKEAEDFYYLYARLIGFSVRKGHMRRGEDGIIKIREWLCCKEGKRDEKYFKRMDRKREAKALTRVDCKARLRILQKKNSHVWMVREFIVEHTHAIADKSHAQFLRSNRKVPEGTLKMARSMKTAGIRTCHIMSYMAQQAGGYDKVKYLIKDLYNQIGKDDDIELADEDAARAIGYLEHKMDRDFRFFGKFSYDAERRLKNLVWVDSQCQADYKLFGHAIAFDTTYKTNDYGKPLLVWVAINHHFKTVVLGFAILFDETIDTYKWVTKAFIECMKGVTPKTVITDGDPAIRSAVLELMPNTVHRLCSWHIWKNAQKNVRDPEFATKLKHLMRRNYSEEVFMEEWDKLIKEFALQRNEWTNQLYHRRRLWAETYLRRYFFGGMSTTQRSEAMNSFLKKKVNGKMKLNEFVRGIDHALSYLRHTEAKDDYYSIHTSPVVGVTNMPEIEAEAAKIYTREMFLRIREQINREGKYIVTVSTTSNELMTFELRKYGVRNCKRKVEYHVVNEVFDCECAYFPSAGIPCRHIFSAMKYMDMTSFPKSLILKQWTMEARKIITTPKETNCIDTCSEESARFGYMTTRLAEVAYLASKKDSVFLIADHEMSRVHMLLLKELEDSGTINMEKKKSIPKYVEVQNPVYTKTKGTSSRRGAHQRGSRKCSYCNNYGHNKTTCKRRGINKTENNRTANSFQKPNDWDSYHRDEDSRTIANTSREQDSVRENIEQWDCNTVNESSEVPNSSTGTYNGSTGFHETIFATTNSENMGIELENDYYNYWGNQFKM